jgi:hypothetical protein
VSLRALQMARWYAGAAMVRAFLAVLALGLAVAQPGFAASAPSKKASAPASRSWGAIAYNSTTGAYGFAVDRTSKRSAEAEAFRQCGGDCDVIRTFRNTCGAIADSERHFAWDTGASREIAEMKARKKCGSDACRILVWACTSGK